MNEHLRAKKPIRTTRAAEGLPRWRWTTADLLRLVELGVLDQQEPIELFGGEIVPMLPTGRRHEVIAEEIAEFWGRRCPSEVWVGIERQFNLDEATYAEPDLILRPTTIKSYDLKGTDVLLVVEVAETSLAKDLGTKARIYASFGVREYWVIDAVAMTTTVHTDPSTDGTYGSIAMFDANAVLTPRLVPALSVRLAGLDLA